jgi:lipopolysaccharide/colanic/teichoic acid biosynthesis glycosyltransferase
MENQNADNILHGALYEKYLKRAIDILLSLVILTIFFPICLVTIFAIKLTSQGPVFADIPERVGQNKKTFKMYKFRSMIMNAHQMLQTDPQFKDLFEEYKKDSYKLKKDPRVTSVGKWIRKHSIDEVPQFLNVLKGDMSIVGPRAYYPDELRNQQLKFPHTRELVAKVLSVKPGITGMWQISGRSEINFDKRIAIDASYVDRLSLMEDLKIIYKTPLIMLTGKGAV